MRTVPTTEPVVSSKLWPGEITRADETETTPVLELLQLLRGRRLSPEADADVGRLITTGTDAEIRSVVAELRHLPVVDATVAEQYAELLKAKADAATCNAIANLEYADQDHDDADGGGDVAPAARRCGVLLEGVRNGKLLYSRAECGTRSCPTCGPRWYGGKLDRLTSKLDGLAQVWVATVADADWRRTQARWSRREGVGWCAIPTPHGYRYVVTNQADARCETMDWVGADVALDGAGMALEASLEPGAPTTGKVSFGGAWRSTETTQATETMSEMTTKPKLAKADDIVWTGVVTKATKLDTIARHAEQLGMTVTPDADSPDGLVVEGGNAVTVAALRERLGVMTWTEMAERRTAKNADALMRELTKRRRAEMRAPKGDA